MATGTSCSTSCLSSCSTYTWGFSDASNPTSISIVATSEDQARKMALHAFDTITRNKEEYRIILRAAQDASRASGDYSQKTSEWEAVYAFWPDRGINPMIGCWCRSIDDFSGDETLFPTSKGMKTFREIVSARPDCRPFCNVLFSSCLDG